MTFLKKTMPLDVLGRALHDYLQGNRKDELLTHTGFGGVEEMPVAEFFRQPIDFPELEHIALALCDGHVLDVGAGAGSHALFLQKQGRDVTALERSPLACEVMRARGVKQVVMADFFAYADGRYDTLLFLMNGIGVAGNIEGLKKLLNHCKTLLAPGGQLLFDSSDITYLYADGAVDRPAGYYGEIRYQYAYKGKRSAPFDWLFVDQDTLIGIARPLGWVVQVLYEDGHDQYLVRMELQHT
ncbi:class I SAM-dependent methyltransferase [Parapedobacter sp. 10938]|uniref:class I SAM-dependent methyltransferase n=1 Tax=Parapedobacter flavus TaxID=3110225 RepID=UPI002DBD810E|nr:class I SAM-dependent methyltransferase [Parapedobacter sp. 10938]MEC3880838.1 class I SAM-dependent methyltransferase [Parapedobacter sp. 10938]